jgi:hypothetical protein
MYKETNSSVANQSLMHHVRKAVPEKHTVQTFLAWTQLQYTRQQVPGCQQIACDNHQICVCKTQQLTILQFSQFTASRNSSKPASPPATLDPDGDATFSTQ